jgi:hypothetical protein
VDPNPYADRAAFQGLPTLGRGVERLARRRQREEESVPLGTYFDSIVAGERRSQSLPVPVELERVALRAELVEELGRPGDVREDERHRSGREGTKHRSYSRSTDAPQRVLRRRAARALRTSLKG